MIKIVFIIVVVLILWSIGRKVSLDKSGSGSNSVEPFYTLFKPYYPKKKTAIPNYQTFTQVYEFNPITVGVPARYNNDYIKMFTNTIFTDLLSTANIAKLKIQTSQRNYQVAELVSQGKYDMGIVSENVLMKLVIKDKNYMSGNPAININPANIHFMTNIYSNYIFVITLAKNPIYTIGDLQGKRIGIGMHRSTTSIAANDLLNYLNFDGQKVPCSVKTCVTKLYNGELDIIIVADYFPNETINNMIRNGIYDPDKKIRILPMDDVNQKQFETEYFYYSRVSVDLNKLHTGYLPVQSNFIKYTKFNPDLTLYSFNMVLICNPRVKSKTIYNIVKNIYENRMLRRFISPRALDYSTTFVPILYHMGATKYYIDKGYISEIPNHNCVMVIGKTKCDKQLLLNHNFILDD